MTQESLASSQPGENDPDLVFDFKDIVYHEYTPVGHTITKEYYNGVHCEILYTEKNYISKTQAAGICNMSWTESMLCNSFWPNMASQ